MAVVNFWFGRSDRISCQCLCEYTAGEAMTCTFWIAKVPGGGGSIQTRVVLLLVAVGISRGPCPARSSDHDCRPESTTHKMYLYKTAQETPPHNTFITTFRVTSRPCNNFHPSLLFHLLLVLILLFYLATNLFN